MLPLVLLYPCAHLLTFALSLSATLTHSTIYSHFLIPPFIYLQHTVPLLNIRLMKSLILYALVYWSHRPSFMPLFHLYTSSQSSVRFYRLLHVLCSLTAPTDPPTHFSRLFTFHSRAVIRLDSFHSSTHWPLKYQNLWTPPHPQKKPNIFPVFYNKINPFSVHFPPISTDPYKPTRTNILQYQSFLSFHVSLLKLDLKLNKNMNNSETIQAILTLLHTHARTHTHTHIEKSRENSQVKT